MPSSLATGPRFKLFSVTKTLTIGTGAKVILKGAAALPTVATSVKGQVAFNTTTNTLHYFDGTAWKQVAVTV